MPAFRPLAERFHEKYQPVPFSGCWIWDGATSTTGYGQINVYRQGRKFAHRVSWQIHNGEIPAGKFVLHRCDTPLCVRPDHLFLGSNLENIQDCVAKGRSGRPTICGEKNVGAKLNAEKVADIKTKRLTQRKFGEIYGVSHTTVGYIQLGKKWKETACV